MSSVARMAVFAIVAALMLTGVHLYIYLRLVRDTTASRRLRRLGKVAVLLLAVALVSARFVYSRLPHWMLVPYSTTTWLWMGLATYLVLTFAVVGFARRGLQLGLWLWRKLRRAPARVPSAAQTANPAQAQGQTADEALAAALTPSVPPVDFGRRLFVSRLVAGSALAASSGIVTFGAFRAFAPPRLTELSVKLPGLPRALDGFCIVHLTDIHVGGIIERKFMAELVDRCNRLGADLVAITGDMVDGDVPTLGPAVAELRRLTPKYGTWFCTGNHDYYSGADEWVEALSGMGVTSLRNRFVTIGDAGASFDLIGVDDWGQRPRGGYDLEAATRGRDPSLPSVLLNHQPQNFSGAVDKGVGLMLSGHTHGGQFFPGTLMAKFIWRYPAGHFTLRDSHIFVSQGTGFWGPPLRVGTGSEIVRVTLLS